MLPEKILFTGMPGSGKGTQTELLLQKHPLPYLSTGEMFRQEMVNKTPLGEQIITLMNTGQYVNDDITNNVVTPYLTQQSYLLDGYPRTYPQAQYLDAINPPEIVILLEVEEETAIKRILHRGETSGRAEDQTVELIKTRIDLYFETMKPVIIHYSSLDKLHVVRADDTTENVHNKIMNLLEHHSR